MVSVTFRNAFELDPLNSAKPVVSEALNSTLELLLLNTASDMMSDSRISVVEFVPLDYFFRMRSLPSKDN